MTRNTYSNQRGITLRSGHVTSARLEPEFWHALRRVAYRQGMSLQALLGLVEVQPRSKGQPFASALRCYRGKRIRDAHQRKLGSRGEDFSRPSRRSYEAEKLGRVT